MLQEIIEVALLNVIEEYISICMLQIAECSIRISDKIHRSNIISYPVKCKQKYAIDGLISRST
jgi:hypothetical protein